jgi:hypothetical protein
MQKVTALLIANKYDLIYFSTTQFPVCILGAYWKKQFGIPYVIDMQDPWHSEYYQEKPKDQHPPKYWFSYRLNKYLEPIALKNADGLISVSENYITDLKDRYPAIKNIPAQTITFGAFDKDIEIAINNKHLFNSMLQPGYTNIVYVGRGGADMHKAITPVFKALQQGLISQPGVYSRLKFYFIGTSYAAAGNGTPTILPLAKQFGVEEHVVETTDRISYYNTLLTLQQADGLFIPGSDDPNYTASKIYPYLLTQKPLLAVFNPKSSAIAILKEYGAKYVYDYETITPLNIDKFLSETIADTPVQYNSEAIVKYSARQMALKQCLLFDKVIDGRN